MPPGECLLEYLNYTCAVALLTSTIQASHLTVTLLQEIPGNVTWYMTDSIAVLEDGYSEVIVNVKALALKRQLFSQM